MAKFNFKKGDTVEIIAGDDRGTKAEVLAVMPKKNKVIRMNTANLSKNVLEKIGCINVASILINVEVCRDYQFHVISCCQEPRAYPVCPAWTVLPAPTDA